MRSSSAIILSCWFCLALVSLTGSRANAQEMSNVKYRSTLKQLDADIPKWQRAFRSLDVDSLHVSYSLGKVIAGNQELALKKLDSLHNSILKELTHSELYNQISISEDLTELMGNLSDISLLLPDGADSKHWNEAGTPIMSAIGEYSGPLQTYMYLSVMVLQARAERCGAK